MYESTERDATVKFDAAKRKPGENAIWRFCTSLARRTHPWHSSATPQQDEVAPSSAPLEACLPGQHPVNRVTRQGKFDWGSFSAFEDGSIEVERAGVKQWFRNLSELKRCLNHSADDRGSATAAVVGGSQRSGE
jgi:hypothetical protein